MPLNDMRGQLYEYTIYETFDYIITRYKMNSVYDNTVIPTNDGFVFLLHVSVRLQTGTKTS